MGVGEITIDSALEESVCPRDWGKQCPMTEPAKFLNFTNVNGGHMQHYAERRATFRADGWGQSWG